MDSTSLFGYAISIILGGGLAKGLGALWSAISKSRQNRVLTESIGAKTPAEVESIAVSTMRTSLESAQAQVKSLQTERIADRDYYQGRIAELTGQLKKVRAEMEAMEKKLADLLEETEKNGQERSSDEFKL